MRPRRGAGMRARGAVSRRGAPAGGAAARGSARTEDEVRAGARSGGEHAVLGEHDEPAIEQFPELDVLPGPAAAARARR